MKTSELMDIAFKAGDILLRSGAEIYRVEETIRRIFDSYDMDCECFVLLTSIFISVKDKKGENVSRLKRLKGNTINLYRIELVNSFSRRLQNSRLTYEEAAKILDGIEKTKSYSFPVRLATAGFTAFIYALIFKGHVYEGVAAFFVSMTIYYIKEKLSSLGVFQFFEFFIAGMFTGGISLAAVAFFPNLSIYKIIAGAIMILVPGVALTNGIKDALYGDVVSSLYRLTEAAFISIAVGSGVAIVLSVGLRWVY